MTEAPTSFNYSSVVSRYSVKIALIIAILNDLEIMACNIGNAQLKSEFREKIWFVAGPECGENAGKKCKLVRVLCGLNSSGSACRALLSHFNHKYLMFTPTGIYPDVCIIKNYKSDNKLYWEYLLVYVNDVLVIIHAP